MISSRSLVSQALPIGPVNVGPTERIVTAGVGGALLLLGLDRGRGTGAILALAGGVLLTRAVTGHCPAYQFLRAGGADGYGRFDPGGEREFDRDDFTNAELRARGPGYRDADRDNRMDKAEVLSGPHPSPEPPQVAREDRVEKGSEYSFPASDPPSYMGNRAGG